MENALEEEDIIPSQKAVTRVAAMIVKEFGRRLKQQQRLDLVMKLVARRTYMMRAELTGSKDPPGGDCPADIHLETAAKGKGKRQPVSASEGFVLTAEDLEPCPLKYIPATDDILMQSKALEMAMDLDGIMVPKGIAEDAISGYIDHFGRRKVDDPLSNWELSYLCDTWAAVNQFLRDSDKEEYLKRHVLALFNQPHVYDAHTCVLFDQRLSVGVLPPFLKRVNLFKKFLPNIFGSNLHTGRKAVANAKAAFKPCAMPAELLLTYMFHCHFRETTSGIQACPVTASTEAKRQQVVNSQCPIVLQVFYDTEGQPTSYAISVSGITTFTMASPADATYYYLSAYYVFHVSPKGANDPTVQLVDKEVAEHAGNSAEPELSAGEQEESDQGAARGPEGRLGCRLGVTNVMVKGKKRLLQETATATAGTRGEKKKKVAIAKRRIVGKKNRSVPVGMYDISMSLHVMAKLLLNVKNSYSLEMDRPMVASAKILENKVRALKTFLIDMQEKNSRGAAASALH